MDSRPDSFNSKKQLIKLKYQSWRRLEVWSITTGTHTQSVCFSWKDTTSSSNSCTKTTVEDKWMQLTGATVTKWNRTDENRWTKEYFFFKKFLDNYSMELTQEVRKIKIKKMLKKENIKIVQKKKKVKNSYYLLRS